MQSWHLPRKLYDFFNKHWLLTAVLATLPGHWFLLVSHAGEQLGLRADGEIEPFATKVFWVLFAASFLFALLKSAADRYNEKAKYNGQIVLQQLLASLNSTIQNKISRIREFIELNHGSKGLEPFKDITQPNKQVAHLLHNIQAALASLFGIAQDKIGLTIVYRTDINREWQWLYAVNSANDLDLQTLVESPHTTFSSLLTSKKASLFFADKRAARDANQYVPGKQDRANNCVGSIVCRDVSVGSDTTPDSLYVEAVLSITTYGHQLCEADDVETQDKILDLILPSFEHRIRLELELLYVREALCTP